MGIILPALLLAHDGMHHRLCWQNQDWWRASVWRHGPYWGVAGIYLVCVSSNLGHALLTDPVRGLTAQVGTQMKALVYYLRSDLSEPLVRHSLDRGHPVSL